MSNQKARKEIVRELREEGSQAFRDGRSRDSCTHAITNKMQWLTGFDFEKASHDANQVDTAVEATLDDEAAPTRRSVRP